MEKNIVNNHSKPKLKTLVIPFVVKQLYPQITLKEF